MGEPEASADQEGEIDDHLVNMIQDIVTEFVAHDGLNFFGRAAVEQVIVEGDANCVQRAADISAHALGLFGGVELIDVIRGYSVSAGHG